MLKSARQKFRITEYIFEHYHLCSFLFVCVIMLISCAEQYSLFGKLFYEDSDCYTRALRILDWLKNFQWSEKVFPYFNPPHGFVLHFTRICDLIWLALSAPLMPFMSVKDAVFYGGMFFSPIFMALTLSTVLWGLKPYLPQLKNQKICFTLFLLICLFILHKLTGAFDFLRPDHHSLMAFIMSVGVAVMLRNHIRVDFRNLFVLGILCGMGMWASSAIEGLFIVAVILAVLIINHIFYGHSGKVLIYFSLGLFLSVTSAWLINPPYEGYAHIDVNRLSIVHSTLAALMLLAFLTLNFLHGLRKYTQIAAFGIVGVVCGAIMLLIFGADNILVSFYDPMIYEIFISHVNEMQHQSLWGYETPAFFFGFCSILWLIYVSELRQPYLVNLLVFFVPISAAALMYRRFFLYYLVIFIVLYGLTLFILLYNAKYKNTYKWSALFYVVGIVFYLAGFNYKPIQHFIPQIHHTLLTDLFLTPEFVYNQETDAVGAPYHTNVEGITDNYKMWFTTNESELKMLLQKHQIQTVYLPPNTRPDYYVEPNNNTDKLYGKIMCDKNVYPWLLKQKSGIYLVDYSKF